MTQDNFADKRVFARFNADCSLRFLDLNSNSEGAGRLSDVSAKGLGMVLGIALPENTPLEVWVDTYGKGEPLYARGKVAWSQKVDVHKYRIGINLERADLMGMSRILRHCHQD
ncbi:MAG: PilZ domain-containing protein [Candidatus Omnitrophica bacterium]|nr:PilZ domain-containing protein [Candidatus Omnitrophota bacterium]